ncbi:hypothetical protein ERJ75_001509300 [Trypanosoma vivax]|nr:hypothetical protein ERJ75_001509300 [Trypanosoma vivax]
MQQRRDAPRHRARRDSCAGGNEWQQALVLWLCGAKGRKVTGLEQAKPTAPHWGGGRRERSELARAEDPARVRPDVPQQRPGTQAVRAGLRRQFCTQQTEVDEKEQKTWGTRSGKVGAGECSVELCVRTTLPLCGGRVERGGGVPYSERKNRGSNESRKCGRG